MLGNEADSEIWHGPLSLISRYKEIIRQEHRLFQSCPIHKPNGEDTYELH